MHRVRAKKHILPVVPLLALFVVASVVFVLIAIVFLQKKTKNPLIEKPAHMPEISQSVHTYDESDISEVQESKLRIPAYGQYPPISIAIAQGWTAKIDTSKEHQITSISNGRDTMEISYQTTQQQTCTPDIRTSEYSSDQANDSTDIVGISHTYRRIKMKGDSRRLIVCELKDGNFIIPTSYGTITYIVSDIRSASNLLEMDVMLASIK